MTRLEAIYNTLCYEVLKGQSAWEMVQDGYDGDFKAYFEDYKDDFEVEETESGYLLTNIISGSKYEAKDGFIFEVDV